MTYRIERTASGTVKVLTISGEIAAGHESDLRRSLHAELAPGVVLDLAGLRVVDRDGVRLLAQCEAGGAILTNCPGYVRTWIDEEGQEGRMTSVQDSVQGEHTFTSSDGLTVFYRSWPAVGAARAVVIIIPGFNSHSGYYGWTAHRLAKENLAVYAVDLRGRGKSDGDRFYVGSFAEYLSDIDALVTLARAAEPGLPVFLLGHSAGGVLACLYALDHQPQLAGLVCESFAFQTPAPDFALAVLRGLSHVFPHAHVVRLKNDDFSRDPEVVASMNADPLIADETQATQTIAELVRADERLAQAFPALTLPVLILHGTADKAARASGSQVFYDSVGATDKTLKLYDGAFHDLLNDLDKDVVITDITSWLRARLTPGRAL